ncbi:MAG: FrgA protein, partial [Myxococcaceae bacterium]
MPARLAQHLVERGLLSAETVEAAQRHRATHGGALDTALLELGGVAEPGMLQALADVSALKPVNLADFEPNPEMARFIPANVAQRLGAVPLSEDGGTLHIACTYPPPMRDLQDVSVLLGRKLELWIAIEARVQEWISSVYSTPLQPRFGVLLASLDPTHPLPAPPPVKQPAPVPVPLQPGGAPVKEDVTLEDALTRDMVEQIARAIAEEPILLEVRKKAEPPPAWAREETVTLAPEHVRQLRESVAAKGREQTVQIDAERARALREAAALPSPGAPRRSP